MNRICIFLFVWILSGPALGATEDYFSSLPSESLPLAKEHLRRAPQDSLLWQFQAISHAMQHDAQKAAQLIDNALEDIGSIVSRGRPWYANLQPERLNPFVGDIHERCVLYFYRGILYWKEGDSANARSAMRSVLVQDADFVSGGMGDWITAEYLDGLFAYRSGSLQYAEEALLRASEHWADQRPGVPFPFPDQYGDVSDHNVHVFFIGGPSIQKIVPAGQRHTAFYRLEKNSAIPKGIQIASQGRPSRFAPFTDSIIWQAQNHERLSDLTRREREKSKSRFQNLSYRFAESSALAGSLPELQGLLLLSTGLAAAASSATRPEADQRHWPGLPGYLGYTSFSLQPGEQTLSYTIHPTTTRPRRQVRIAVPSEGDLVVFLKP